MDNLIQIFAFLFISFHCCSKARELSQLQFAANRIYILLIVPELCFYISDLQLNSFIHFRKCDYKSAQIWATQLPVQSFVTVQFPFQLREDLNAPTSVHVSSRSLNHQRSATFVLRNHQRNICSQFLSLFGLFSSNK